MMHHASNSELCARCKKKVLVDSVTGECFCSSCGFVVSEKILESGPESHSFSKDERGEKSRTGAPTSLTMYDMGLATIINPLNRDATGRPLSTSVRSIIERLRTWDSRSQIHNATERNLRQAFNELNRLKDKLVLSDNVLEKSAYIYRKAVEKNLVRGRSISAMIASSLYAACRNTETPRTLKDVGIAANLKRKDIARCYRLLLIELELKMPVVNSVQCISRIASRSGISEKTKRDALKVLNAATTHRESFGKSPMGLAAAALYLMCIDNGEQITQREIAESANVTEVTIRNRCRGLKIDIESNNKKHD